MNAYALEKIAASYGREMRSAAAATGRARKARRARHTESLPDVAAGPGSREGFLAGAVPRPRESEEAMTHRAA
jgi:hypothetical protein